MSDGKETSAPDQVIIDVVANSPPAADAGPDETVVEGSTVELDGTGSSDADGGDVLAFSWSGPVALNGSTSATPSFTAPAVGPGGTTLAFVLTVTDDDAVNPLSHSDQVLITVQDANDPPVCTRARAACPDSKIKSSNGCTIWPPNHKMLKINITGVSDSDNQTLSILLTSVTQDEPVNSLENGDTSPDAIVSGDSVLIRAERSGAGNGRVYAVSFVADDGDGGVCSGIVSVGVPHDRTDVPVDDGQAYDSTQP